MISCGGIPCVTTKIPVSWLDLGMPEPGQTLMIYNIKDWFQNMPLFCKVGKCNKLNE